MILEDISTLTKPQNAKATIKRAKQYIDHMRTANKPVDHVALSKADYDAILRTVNTNRAKDPNLAQANGLRIGDIRLTRGAE